jgi:hypothetical protein
MEASQRATLIGRYEEGFEVVRAALDGATDAALDARLAPTDWTAREVVHHLADSEMTSAIRLRRLLAEPGAIILGYDETAFAKRCHYDRPIEASLEAFRAARVVTAEILHRLGDEEWARTGTHSESGTYSVETWLEIYAAHAHDHAEQMRASMGIA